jgi:hypothetical protein
MLVVAAAQVGSIGSLALQGGSELTYLLLQGF